jgi:putative acetyltransferase
MSLQIRPESAAEWDGIWTLHAEAFPTRAEADLVNRLRDDGDAVISLAAIVDGNIAGHVLFSKMQSPERFLGLAPVAAHVSHRRQEIAEALIREGLVRAKADGWAGVFVLGGNYYKRFGFDPSLAAGFRSPYAGPHLMALSLQPEGLGVRTDPVEYARAFAAL